MNREKLQLPTWYSGSASMSRRQELAELFRMVMWAQAWLARDQHHHSTMPILRFLEQVESHFRYEVPRTPALKKRKYGKTVHQSALEG